MLRAPSFPLFSAERVGNEKVDEHYTISENALTFGCLSPARSLFRKQGALREADFAKGNIVDAE
jgi:hypothetical protein